MVSSQRGSTTARLDGPWDTAAQSGVSHSSCEEPAPLTRHVRSPPGHHRDLLVQQQIGGTLSPSA